MHLGTYWARIKTGRDWFWFSRTLLSITNAFIYRLREANSFMPTLFTCVLEMNLCNYLNDENGWHKFTSSNVPSQNKKKMQLNLVNHKWCLYLLSSYRKPTQIPTSIRWIIWKVRIYSSKNDLIVILACFWWNITCSFCNIRQQRILMI